MAHHKLRENKTCLNCGNVVASRFCSECGQENVETKHSFHYLMTHFIEDLVHYDSSFWKTLKHLLFNPGLLTKEYLEGRRKKYVAPVKLYIFVSFFVFFVGSWMSKVSNSLLHERNNEYKEQSANQLDSLATNNNYKFLFFELKESSIEEYNFRQNSLPKELRDGYFDRKAKTKALYLKENYSPQEISAKIFGALSSNFPKLLFFYMPVFAFFIWLFFNKKKWYYFDHGIFTLHFFSFLLISFFWISSVLEPLSYLSITQHHFFDYLFGGISFAILLWTIIYFFKALKTVYSYSKINTFIRGLFILTASIFCFVLALTYYVYLILFII